MAGVPRKPSDNFDPWQGWELSARNPFLPVGEYTNEAGDVSAGFAMPSIVSEPVNALARLLSTPAGTMPNPQNPEMQQDALTGLLSLYGGNAVSGMARGAGRNALASKALSDTGQPSPVGSAIGSALDMSPEARLARAREQGFDTGNVYYHGTGNANDLIAFDPKFAGQGNDQIGSGFYFTDNPETASHYATARASFDVPKIGGEGSPGVLPVYLRLNKPINIPEGSANLSNLDFSLSPTQAREIISRAPGIRDPDTTPIGNWHDPYASGVEDWMIDDVANSYAHNNLIALENDFFQGAEGAKAFREALRDATGFDGVTMKIPGTNETHKVAWFPEQIRSVNAAFDPARFGENGLLLSDTGRPSIMGGAIASGADWSPASMAERMQQKNQQARWHHSNIADRMRQKLEARQPAAAPLGPQAEELRQTARELEAPPRNEMTPTARGTSIGSAGLKPAVMIDGKIYSGPNHALAALDSGLTIEEASTLLYNNEMRDGYVTSRGQFLTRTQALEHLGLSTNSGPLTTKRLSRIEGSDGGGSLFSDQRPSLMGSAVAGSGEFDPYADIPTWLLGLDERVTY